MGVMACFRKDCENIMCDTYIDAVGYVCNECQREFKEALEVQNINPLTEGEITRELQRFMITPKGQYEKGEEITVDNFFKQHTK